MPRSTRARAGTKDKGIKRTRPVDQRDSDEKMLNEEMTEGSEEESEEDFEEDYEEQEPTRSQPRRSTRVTRMLYDQTEDKQLLPRKTTIHVDLPDFPPVLLPVLDLTLIQDESTKKLTKREILDFIKSGSVLPVLKCFANTFSKPDQESHKVYRALTQLFAVSKRPYTQEVEMIATFARDARAFELNRQDSEVILDMAQRVNTIVHVKYDAYFKLLSASMWSGGGPYKYVVRLLITIFLDLSNNRENGFFGILLNSELAKPMLPQPRKVFEMWYLTDLSLQGEGEKKLAVLPPYQSPETLSAKLHRELYALKQQRADIKVALEVKEDQIQRKKEAIAALTREQ